MNQKAIIISPERPQGRAWGATVQALGSSVEILDAYSAPDPNTNLVVISARTGDPNSLVEYTFSLAQHSSAVVVLPEFDLASSVHLFRSPAVKTVLAEEYADSRLLAYVCSRLLQGDIFGIWKAIPWGAQVHSMLVNSHNERTRALAAVEQYLGALRVRGKHSDAIRLATDELLMNALYNAPVGSSGPLFAEVAPKDRSSLRLERPVIMQLASDGARVAVGVRDSFGSLARATVLSTLKRCMQSPDQIDRKTSGAGLGLYMVASNSTEVIINVLPGTATEVICVFDLQSPGQQLRHFGFYEETFAPNADIEDSRPARLVGTAPANPGLPRLIPAALMATLTLLLAMAALLLWPHLNRPDKGAVKVTVSPPGSTVYVDGARQGVASPVLTIDNLEVSTGHAIVARREGYHEAQEVVTVAAGRTQTIMLTLARIGARVHVTSTPSGAAISLDGKPTGRQTPAVLDGLMPARKYVVRLTRHGYSPVETRIVPSTSETLLMQLALPLAGGFARLTATSAPDGARLLVNEVDTGLMTPVERHVLRAGQAYMISLELEDHVPWRERIAPAAGELVSRSVTLQPGGPVTIRANIEARLSVAGREQPLPLVSLMLPTGTHLVRIRGKNPFVDHTFPIKVKQGGRITRVVQFGTVAVQGPDAVVVVNPQVKVKRLALRPGKHVISIENTQSGKIRKKQLTVTANKEIKVAPVP